jgi:hypothetical protein
MLSLQTTFDNSNEYISKLKLITAIPRQIYALTLKYTVNGKNQSQWNISVRYRDERNIIMVVVTSIYW